MPKYRGYIFDLDGTAYLGENLIPGAAQTIAERKCYRPTQLALSLIFD